MDIHAFKIINHRMILQHYAKVWEHQDSCIMANKSWYKSLTVDATMLFNEVTEGR